jgi:hypothetical protein
MSEPAVACAVALAVAVSLEAQQPQENRARHFGPNDCGPADPAYIRVANESGGQPMFLQPSEAAKSGHLMREVTNRETVLWATGRLGEGPGEFVVPVDSSIKRITFVLSVDTKGGAMSVVRPSGAEVQPGGAGTEISELNCGRIVTVAAPEPGQWRLRLTGSGQFWLTSSAQTEIAFLSVEFVKLGGRPGHEGLFPISGRPLTGKRATLEVDLSQAVKAAEFHLVSERGDILAPVRMHIDSSDEDSHEYFGELDLPAVPFRVAMAGKDSRGNAFQRFFHTLFHAESVEITLADHSEVPPGGTTRVTFTVHNIGPPSTFRIDATAGKRLVSRVEPPELSLATGERKTVTVEMTLADGTRSGLRSDDLTVTATSTSGRSTSNWATVSLSAFD